MRRRKDIHIIGIDPDVGKSGVAYLVKSTKVLEVTDLLFPELLDYLQFAKKESVENGKPLIVVVEAGWLNKSNWHVHSKQSKNVAAEIGRKVGMNHAVGINIIEMCKHYDIDAVEQRPLKKCWKGTDGKITHEELAYFTNLTGRTNQEKRDAVLLAWNYANLPIRMKV